MPDGYSASSHAAALGSIGAGLLDTYFPALKQQRDQNEADKKYEKELQMQALHDLIASGNTKVADVPRLMKMHADLAGIGKLPGVQEIIDNMQQAATRQVPYGPEQETMQSQGARFSAQPTPSQQAPITSPITTSIAMRPVPPEPQTKVVMGAPVPVASGTPNPPTYLTDSTAPASITTPALKVVPPEPVMYQPTRAAGELTQDEYADLRKTSLYNAQQEAMLKRQSDLAEAAGDRQAKRDADRQLAQINQIRTRAEEARKTQEQLFENKIKMLEPTVQAQAKKRVFDIAATLNPNIPYEDRLQQARDYALSEIQLGIATKKQAIEKSKAEISHWKAIDARALVGKGGAATQGMTAGQARIFRVNTLDILPDLNATRTQLLKLQNDLALLGGKDPAIEARIKELSDKQDGLLLRLKDERDKILAPIQTAPAAPAPAGSPRAAKPVNDPLGIFK